MRLLHAHMNGIFSFVVKQFEPYHHTSSWQCAIICVRTQQINLLMAFLSGLHVSPRRRTWVLSTEHSHYVARAGASAPARALRYDIATTTLVLRCHIWVSPHVCVRFDDGSRRGGQALVGLQEDPTVGVSLTSLGG